MDARAELTTLILGKTAPRAADAVIAAGYSKLHTITTAEELDALPDLSVVLDQHGEAFQRMQTDDASTALWLSGDVILSASMALPATVLYTPEAEG